MDNVYTLNEIVQERLREDKKTHAFFFRYNLYRKLMILFGMMVYGIKSGIWV